MEIGVFLPIGNNGWLISETAPQYRPTFDLNREVTLKAERYGFDFALSMIKLRGFGGKTEFWDHNLESFTLMAGLAAVTTRIRLFATAATLANAELNGVAVLAQTGDLVGQPCRWDLILCGDVCYEAPMTRHILPWLLRMAAFCEVWIADPGRAYLPGDGLTPLGDYPVPTSLELEDRALRPTRLYRLSEG